MCTYCLEVEPDGAASSFLKTLMADLFRTVHPGDSVGLPWAIQNTRDQQSFSYPGKMCGVNVKATLFHLLVLDFEVEKKWSTYCCVLTSRRTLQN